MRRPRCSFGRCFWPVPFPPWLVPGSMVPCPSQLRLLLPVRYSPLAVSLFVNFAPEFPISLILAITIRPCSRLVHHRPGLTILTANSILRDLGVIIREMNFPSMKQTIDCELRRCMDTTSRRRLNDVVFRFGKILILCK